MGRSAATAKPIGAHPILGCPFAMYQISSVTHMFKPYYTIAYMFLHQMMNNFIISYTYHRINYHVA